MRNQVKHGTGNRVRKKKPERPLDNPEQSRRFEEIARELGSDQTGRAFKKEIKIVVPTKSRRPTPKGKHLSPE